MHLQRSVFRAINCAKGKDYNLIGIVLVPSHAFNVMQDLLVIISYRKWSIAVRDMWNPACLCLTISSKSEIDKSLQSVRLAVSIIHLRLGESPNTFVF